MATSFVYAGQYGPETALNSAGKILPNTQATVYLHNTLTLASLFTDRTKAQMAGNPVSTDALGNLTFFANPGQYDVSLAGTTLTVLVPIDPAELIAEVPTHLSRLTILGNGFQSGNMYIGDWERSLGIRLGRLLGVPSENIHNYANDGAQLLAAGIQQATLAVSNASGTLTAGTQYNYAITYDCADFSVNIGTNTPGNLGMGVWPGPLVVTNPGSPPAFMPLPPGSTIPQETYLGQTTGNQTGQTGYTLTVTPVAKGQVINAVNVYRDTGNTGTFHYLTSFACASYSAVTFTDNGSVSPSATRVLPAQPSFFVGWLNNFLGKGGWVQDFQNLHNPGQKAPQGTGDSSLIAEPTFAGVGGGAGVAAWNYASGTSPSRTGGYLIGYGEDEAIGYTGGTQGTDTLMPNAFAQAVVALVSRCRASIYLPTNDGSIAYGGGFATYSTLGDRQTRQNLYQANTAASATVTITVPTRFPGGTIVLYLVGGNGTQTGGYGGTGTVTLDGTAVAGSPFNGVLLGSTNTIGFAIPYCIRIPNVAKGAHTILLTVTAAGANNLVGFDGWSLDASPAPPVVVRSPVRPSGFGAQYATIVSMQNALKTALAAQFTDGLVVYADVDSTLAQNTNYFESTLGYYPNEIGGPLAAQTCYQAFANMPLVTAGATPNL